MAAIRILVGLGNPGRDYERTRHNAGFWLLERFASSQGVALRKEAKYDAYVGRHEASGAWLLLPQTFMNLSGKSVGFLAGFFKIPAEEVLVVHDELDFTPGTAKLKQGGGVAGHNGLRDIGARLGSTNFWRLRLGIGHPGDRNVVADYVLGKPSPEDREAIDRSIDRALEVLPLCLGGSMQDAMLKLHSSDKPAKKPAPPPQEKA
ncbi:MAG: aminoacyl-tRNA hydrolase [Proteobacteria bacterium]|nr:aminoacyl-tRNA hydrolase [Pseudomonadota bacterium]